MKIYMNDIEGIKNFCKQMENGKHVSLYTEGQANGDFSCLEIKRFSLDGADSMFVYGLIGCEYEFYHVWENRDESEDFHFTQLAKRISTYADKWETQYITDEDESEDEE